ncbi:hypothetical protein ERO13_D02G050050v2 [Gossypium hirsutum]|uniref:Uncharacterized protein n=2 Tax=Gossypium TaxID=3633 RepID=A0A5J5SB55_GOSBA|nr:hypothetical protein ES319_D02G056600v1 [Gossypium barbadense]KAG4157235.1 hypothetical protein ERO13_D02G050050v2 [Gossypium hirsutum]TYG78463.1 hypothetical protein ES288_D02G060800v1 [Gossypium darwinii]
MTNRVIFATINNYVDKINEKMINIFPGDSKIFSSFDQAMDDTNDNYLEKFLNTLLPNDLPPHKLILKITIDQLARSQVLLSRIPLTCRK